MLFRDLQIGRCRHDENFTEVVRTNLNRLICWINSVDAGTLSQSSSGAQSKIKNRTITESSFQCQSKLKPVLQIEHEFAKFKSPIWSKLKKEKFCSELSKSLKLLKLENWTCTFMNCLSGVFSLRIDQTHRANFEIQTRFIPALWIQSSNTIHRTLFIEHGELFSDAHRQSVSRTLRKKLFKTFFREPLEEPAWC